MVGVCRDWAVTVVAFVLTLVTGAAAGAGEPPVVIRGVTVVDVVEGKTAPGRTVVIRDGVIESILGGAEMVVPPEGARGIDGAGLYLMPGLFDAHVHYVEPETFGRLMIANGVTFVRETGNVTETILDVRDRLNSGQLLGPRMIATGAIIDGDPPVWPFSEPCDTPEEARAAVRKLHEAGVDQIKVYSRLDREVYLAAAEEARNLGLKVVGHVPLACGIEDAIDAGQSSIEHFSRVEDLIERLAPGDRHGRGSGFAQMRAWARLGEVDEAALAAELRKLAVAGIVQCPTLVVLAGIGEMAEEGADAAEDPLLAYVPTGLRNFWGSDTYKGWARQAGELVEPMQRMLAAMHRAGVPLMIGTDLANPYIFAGFSVHREMALWAEAGIPAADILRAATVGPAVFCGVGDRYGTVVEGKRASLVLVEGNPLEDVSNAAKIRAVVLDGRVFERGDLDQLLEEARGIVAAGEEVKGDEKDGVDLALPGETIARGRYVAKFGQFDAGVEEFHITKDENGYHVKAISRPQGGFQKPCVVTVHAGADLAPVSAEYRELTRQGTAAAYTIVGGAEGTRVEAREIGAEGKREEAAPQVVEATGAWMFAGPITAGDFIAIQQLGLEVGQERTVTVVGFGWTQPAWRLGATEATLRRHEDTTVSRGREEVPARRYTGVMKTPMGDFKSQTWTDMRGVVLRSVVVMPFGTVGVELE